MERGVSETSDGGVRRKNLVMGTDEAVGKGVGVKVQGPGRFPGRLRGSGVRWNLDGKGRPRSAADVDQDFFGMVRRRRTLALGPVIVDGQIAS